MDDDRARLTTSPARHVAATVPASTATRQGTQTKATTTDTRSTPSMALYTTPETHAANPPESWTVAKTGPRSWALTDQHGGILQTTATRREAEALRTSGFYFNLWHDERRWYAGEPVQGWKPYQPAMPEAEAAERIAAGVAAGNLSWGDVAEQSARGWCPASPEGTEPHKVADAEPYTLHYISADAPGDETTWSVYRERYISRDHDEPIDGSQEHISTHATEAEADAEARRLQLSA